MNIFHKIKPFIYKFLQNNRHNFIYTSWIAGAFYSIYGIYNLKDNEIIILREILFIILSETPKIFK